MWCDFDSDLRLCGATLCHHKTCTILLQQHCCVKYSVSSCATHTCIPPHLCYVKSFGSSCATHTCTVYTTTSLLREVLWVAPVLLTLVHHHISATWSPLGFSCFRKPPALFLFISSSPRCSMPSSYRKSLLPPSIPSPSLLTSIPPSHLS